MKRVLLLMALLTFLITNLCANVGDSRKPISLRDISKRQLIPNSRFTPAYTFAIEPVSIVDNYYDYFPGSYSGNPVQRVQTDNLDGNFLTFHFQGTASSERKIYHAYVDNTGSVSYDGIFGASNGREGYPALTMSGGGKPLVAYHVDIDDDESLEVVFRHNAMLDNNLYFHSEPLNIIDNPVEIMVDGEAISTNEFIWPSIQIGDSPINSLKRVYILAKNAITNGSGFSENVIIYFNDFNEEDLESQDWTSSSWSSTTIPQLDAWNVSNGDLRRAYMSFIAHEDKIYYIGYHTAYSGSSTNAIPLEEGKLTAFVCDNYGAGVWTQHSTFGEFASINPPYIDPYTGDELVPAQYYFNDNITDEMLSNSMGQSKNFNAGVDNEGRIHFPAFYTLNVDDGSYFHDFHTVKNITFDTNTLEWNLAEVYPQQRNGTEPFIPNDPIDITQYDSMEKYPHDALWQWWDQDGDGLYDEILDDGTWDGVDDSITEDLTEYWGRPIVSTIWPYMYWDINAADGAMMHHLHTAQITDANDEGMMAMVWQETWGSALFKNLDSYPQNKEWEYMCGLVISVSNDNGRHWSEPIFLNGVDTAEMAEEIPEFPYLGNEIDYVGLDEDGNKIGRIYVMYLDDDTYGSSVQSIGQSTGGSMKFMALDVTFTDAPTSSSDNDVVPNMSMLKQNYPNPFNPTTRINYNVVKSGNVKLNVYNVKGQLVKTLVNSTKSAGLNEVVWNGDDNAGKKVSSGLYLYKLENGGRSEMKKMVIMK